MELKRYVLLDKNNHYRGSENNLIIDLNQTWEDTNTLVLCEKTDKLIPKKQNTYEVVDNRVYSNFFVITTKPFIGNILKTSDNIIDLVEVGDLVNGSQCIYASEVTRIEDKEIYTSIWCHWKNEITTIWKKQPNGDYKRYEVK